MATSEFEDGPIGQMRIIGWFAAALLASVLVGGLLQYMEAKYYTAQSKAEIVAKTELLRAAMLEDIITEDRGRLETTVELYQESNPNFYAFTVADEDGNALLSWERNSNLEPRKVLMFFTRYYPRQRSVVPVVFEDENYGMITAVWDRSTAGAKLDSHIYAMAGMVGFLCFAFAFIGYRTGRRHRHS